MQTGYYSAAAGMVTQFNRLDTIANNLANVNTVGFKEDDVVVGDFMRVFKESRDTLDNPNDTKEAAAFINRTMTRTPQIVDSYTNQSLGTMQKTDNPLDVALTQEGIFFAIKTPQGIRLTRDGSFTTNDEGKLVTKDGYEVLAASDDLKSANPQGITLDNNYAMLKIDKNGQLSTNVPNGYKMVKGQQLFIAQPDNLKMLQKEGSSLYKYENITSLEPLDESGAVKQGFLEKSNVNAVSMMTQMIETNRLVGMYQSAMDTQMNEMNKDAIEKLARKA